MLDDYPDSRRLGPARGMCAGQRFLRHPRLSDCSATWVGSDQVITAGHCFKYYGCDETAYVFKYYVTGYDHWSWNNDPTFPEITTDDVVQPGRGGRGWGRYQLTRPSTPSPLPTVLLLQRRH